MTSDISIGPLFTDLYELTMAAGYFEHQVTEPATFTLSTRESIHRNFFIAAGLEDVLDGLAAFRFSSDDIAYLQGTRLFKPSFLEYLKSWRFSGDLVAMPEGTVFFANEPIIEVTAPLIEAQIIETFLLNTIGLQSMIATKAARCVHAAQGRALIDFALRRTHGWDAGVKVARSTYLAGFDGTSNVLAGQRYGIPVSGTMAHSYVLAFENEAQAFQAYADTFPDKSIFLIDTYDTIDGAHQAVRVAQAMKAQKSNLVGVRLDSGDMVALSQAVRRILDDAGLTDVKIFASSGFDEFKIADVLADGARIDAFGVGTKVGVSADAPYMDVVYKVVQFNGRQVRKLSPHKVTLAGAKQVFRSLSGDQIEDVIGLRDEDVKGMTPMLESVMKQGRCTRGHPSLDEIRTHCRANLAALPERYKAISAYTSAPVRLSAQLDQIQKRLGGS